VSAAPATAWVALVACGSTAGSSSSGGITPPPPTDGGPSAEASPPFPDGAPIPVDALADGPAPPPPPQGDGHVTFRFNGQWYGVEAKEGATPANLTPGLDAISSGSDVFLNPSKDGKWLAAIGSRFGCLSGSCLDEFAGDASNGGPIPGASAPLATGQGRPAVASGGDVVVYPAAGTHNVDLYAIKRSNGAWGAPVLLTGDSSFPFHHDVAIAWDGSRIVFDCGQENYGVPPTSICEVATDGTGFKVVLNPEDGPDQSTSHALHHPDYTPEGDFVFEADWASEQVWKLPRGTKTPVKVSPDTESDDNSPCVLPDGRIASLWLGRAGNAQGMHELKVMNADGSGSVMVLTGQDIVDIGIGCGN
jgi:hypothetical protein